MTELSVGMKLQAPALGEPAEARKEFHFGIDQVAGVALVAEKLQKTPVEQTKFLVAVWLTKEIMVAAQLRFLEEQQVYQQLTQQVAVQTGPPGAPKTAAWLRMKHRHRMEQAVVKMLQVAFLPAKPAEVGTERYHRTEKAAIKTL